MDLNEKQVALCAENKIDFSDLRAVFFNCTLNPHSPSNSLISLS